MFVMKDIHNACHKLAGKYFAIYKKADKNTTWIMRIIYRNRFIHILTQ